MNETSPCDTGEETDEMELILNELNDSNSNSTDVPPIEGVTVDVDELSNDVQSCLSNVTQSIVDNFPDGADIKDELETEITIENNEDSKDEVKNEKAEKDVKEDPEPDNPCPLCGSSSEMRQSKRSTFRTRNRAQACWLYRLTCSDRQCAHAFGPNHRFDKNQFVEVDEDGRPLIEAPRSGPLIPEVKSEKVNGTSDTNIATAPALTTDVIKMETNESSRVEIGDMTVDLDVTDVVEEEFNLSTASSSASSAKRGKGAARGRGRGRPRLTSVKRKAAKRELGETETKVAETVQPVEPIEPAKKRTRQARGYVYIDETGNEVDPNTGKPKRDPTPPPPPPPPAPTPNKSGKRGAMMATASKRGRPFKGSTAIPVLSSPSSSSSQIPPAPAVCARRSFDDADTQTGCDEHTRSILVEKMIRKELRRHVGAVAKGNMPEKVTVVFQRRLLMAQKLLKEQAEEVVRLREANKKMKVVIPKVAETVRIVKLTYMDELRRLRDDVVVLRDEFKLHHLELISEGRRTKERLAKERNAAQTKYNDLALQMKKTEATLRMREKEVEYEKDRAEYYSRKKDEKEMIAHEAKMFAKDVGRKLDDTLFIKDNERCTHCLVSEKMRKRMTRDVANMTMEVEKAKKEREEFEKRCDQAEQCAMLLGKQTDKANYEARSWKARFETLTKEMTDYKEKMHQKIAKLAAQDAVAASSTPPVAFSGGNTPRDKDPKNTSVSYTPKSSEKSVSPPEDGEVREDESSNSSKPSTAGAGAVNVPRPSPSETKSDRVAPTPESKPKPKPQQPQPQIDAGFASWIPKEKLDAPAPAVPKALTPFGVPIRMPGEKKKDPTPTMALSSMPVPWDTSAPSSLRQSGSESLAAVVAQVEAENFLRGGESFKMTPKTNETEKSKDIVVRNGVTIDINTLGKKARKRLVREMAEEEEAALEKKRKEVSKGYRKEFSTNAPYSGQRNDSSKNTPTSSNSASSTPTQVPVERKIRSSDVPIGGYDGMRRITAVTSHPAPVGARGSVLEMKKIPKKGERAPSPGLLGALGVGVSTDGQSKSNSGDGPCKIPGLSLLSPGASVQEPKPSTSNAPAAPTPVANPKPATPAKPAVPVSNSNAKPTVPTVNAKPAVPPAASTIAPAKVKERQTLIRDLPKTAQKAPERNPNPRPFFNGPMLSEPLQSRPLLNAFGVRIPSPTPNRDPRVPSPPVYNGLGRNALPNMQHHKPGMIPWNGPIGIGQREPMERREPEPSISRFAQLPWHRPVDETPSFFNQTEKMMPRSHDPMTNRALQDPFGVRRDEQWAGPRPGPAPLMPPPLVQSRSWGDDPNRLWNTPMMPPQQQQLPPRRDPPMNEPGRRSFWD